MYGVATEWEQHVYCTVSRPNGSNIAQCGDSLDVTSTASKRLNLNNPIQETVRFRSVGLSNPLLFSVPKGRDIYTEEDFYLSRIRELENL